MNPDRNKGEIILEPPLKEVLELALVQIVDPRYRESIDGALCGPIHLFVFTRDLRFFFANGCTEAR